MSWKKRLPKSRDSGPTGSRLQIVLLPDLGQPLDLLLAQLSPVEREQAEQRGPTERRRRQFVLGRLAARRAAGRALVRQRRCSSVEVLTGQDGGPVVQVDGARDVVSVSLAHSGRLALACAWPNMAGEGYRAGVDLERVRPTDVARSRYAFSGRERALLARVPEGLLLAGLAAWTAKEAAWKALGPAQGFDPAGVRLRALNLAGGLAVVEASSGRPRLGVRLGFVAGPDGIYLLSLARFPLHPLPCRFSALLSGDVEHE